MTNAELTALRPVVLRAARQALLLLGAHGYANSPEDVAQDALVKLAKFPKVNLQLTCRVVKNCAKDAARADERNAPKPVRTPPRPDRSGQEAARQRLEDLKNHMGNLTPRQRQIIKVITVYNGNINSAARHIGISRGNIHTQLKRIRDILADFV